MEERDQTYWAWKDYKTGKYRHLYPNRRTVEICSADGFRSAEARGEGKIVEVDIQEVKVP